MICTMPGCKNKTRGPDFEHCWRHVSCRSCLDMGFVRDKLTKKVEPCPDCNPDGKDLEGEPS